MSNSILGVGPAVVLPSTSEPTLGSGKWSVGPTAVALDQTGPWTYGALWNQIPASYQLGFGAFPVHPDLGLSWKIRGAHRHSLAGPGQVTHLHESGEENTQLAAIL